MSIWDGIFIGGAGGAIAGLTVWCVQFFHIKIVVKRDKERIYEWLNQNTSDMPGKQFRSTRTIASWNNLTQERVQFIGSIDDRIHLSTGNNEDMWGIRERIKRGN